MGAVTAPEHLCGCLLISCDECRIMQGSCHLCESKEVYASGDLSKGK